MERLWEMVVSIPALWQGFLMAFVLSVLRLWYDDQETRPIRVFLEAMICGFLTLSVSAAFGWLGLPENMAVAVGGAIGFLGVNRIRMAALKYLKLKGK